MTFLRFVLGLVFLITAFVLVQPGPLPAREQRTWEALFLPLAPGRTAALDYVLGPPRRGQEDDIVVALRSAGTGAVIEVHVLDRGRWKGIRETASFGVAYETPRSNAQVSDCEAVTEAIAQALRARDPGGLGPVNAIPLAADPEPPRASRVLDRVFGARGVAVGVCIAGFTWIVATMPGGAWAVSVWLALLGLLVRAPELGLPFVRDQDVQRLYTGHLSLSEILLGQGLRDRHPPLYFLVLHAAQRFGQSEAVVRAPAVLFGALVGPFVVWGARAHGRRADVAALAALAVTLSAPLIAGSREVSSIPLFALLSIAVSVSLVKHVDAPSRAWTWVLAASFALSLWTYYLAPFVLAGCMLPLLVRGRIPRRTWVAVGIGAAAGSPALILAVVTFFRDRSARAVAAAHPGLAWGQRESLEVAGSMITLSWAALGVSLGVVLLGAVMALLGRQRASLVPLCGLGATFAGICVLAPVARVQPYYLTAVLPLAVLSVALLPDLSRGAARRLLPGSLALLAALSVVPGLASARSLYLPDPDAFMPAFAQAIEESPERRVVTVAHYDSTLLAYYLARRRGVPMDWDRMLSDRAEGGFALRGVDRVLIPLVEVHAMGDDPAETALARLEELLQKGPLLVIERDGFLLPRLHDRLQRCRRLREAGTGRLYRCL